jgi:hypothetical protein
MGNIIDNLLFLWYNGNKLENKFAAYQGYRQNSIVNWKHQTGLSWSLIMKLLWKFEIYNSRKIRQLISQVVSDNEHIFSREQCFITGFGNTGKSGDVILYEYSHTRTIINQPRIKKTWEINNLPPGSTIIFVEDIIGTGSQSVEYINTKLNSLLAPSHQPYLFSLCASPKGINNILNNTGFQVIYGSLLEEHTHQFYSDSCDFFSQKEKQKIKRVNSLLKKPGQYDFDLGLLLAFYFTIPNNAMPIFWKDQYNYTTESGEMKNWSALLPRQF